MIRFAIISFFVLLFVGPAFGQAPEKLFVGNCSFSGFALVSDSTYTGDIIRFDDRMGDGYNLTQLQAGDEIFDGRGLVFEIDVVNSATNFTADVTVTAKVDRGFEPFGSGQVYRPTAAGLIPPSSQEQAGLSPTQKARIDRHNVVTMQSLIGDRDTVYSITNVSDTSALSPQIGYIFVNSTADTLGVYDGDGWVLFYGGGGSTEQADGLTILGDGSPPNPFRNDTAFIATRYYVDSLFTVADSLRELGDKSAPILIPLFDRNTQLNNCATSETVATGFLLIDDTAIIEGDITFEIDASPASITYDIYNSDSTAYYFETATSRAAGTYFWEVGYTDADGNFVGDLNSFYVVAGRPDTVTVPDPPGQAEIWVTRVCGVEISRDTIAVGTVTSVGLTLPSQFSVSGSPVTTSGTLAGAWVNQAQNTVLAGPASGADAAPTFRSLVAADLPNTAVTPGSYTNTNLTIDVQGRIISASNGSAGISGLTGNYLTKATSATTIGNSLIYDNGTNIGIGTVSPTAKIHVNDTGSDNATIMQLGKTFTNTAVETEYSTRFATIFNPAAASGTEFLAHSFSLSLPSDFDMNGATRGIVTKLSSSGAGRMSKGVGVQSDISITGTANSPETLNFLGYVTMSGTGRTTLADGIKVTSSGAIDWYRGFVGSTAQNGINLETPKKVTLFYADDLAADSVAYFLYSAGTNDQNYLEGNTGIGISAPTEKLSVDGNIFGTGNLTLNSTSVITGFNTNVGINETAATAQLHVDQNNIGNSGQPGVTISATSSETNSISNKAHLRLTNESGANNTFARLDFADSETGNSTAFLQGIFTDAANDYGDLSFYTRSASGMTEKLRIYSTYVGAEGADFATPSTGANLEIRTKDALAADKGGSISLGGVHRSDGQKYTFARIKAGKTNATHGNTGGYLSFMTTTNEVGTTEKMRIKSDGNVGIGDTNPDSKLEIAAGTTTVSPLGLNSGPLLTTPLVGKLEFLTDRLYFTQTTGTTRNTIAYLSDIPAVNTSTGFAPIWDGDSWEDSDMEYDGTTTTIGFGSDEVLIIPSDLVEIRSDLITLGEDSGASAPNLVTIDAANSSITIGNNPGSINVIGDYINVNNRENPFGGTDGLEAWLDSLSAKVPEALHNATYYEEGIREYTYSTDTITIDTFSLALGTDSITASDGLIENLKSDTVRWQISYSFFADSDEDNSTAFFDLTTDGSESPTAIPGSKTRSDASGAGGAQHAGATFTVDVPPGEKIRLCQHGNIGVATGVDISYLTISINEINR